MTVTGNWELYKFSVKTDKSVWVPIWQADLPSITYEEPRGQAHVHAPAHRV